MQDLAARLQARIPGAHNADTTFFADQVVALWQEISAVFAPIIGQRGVDALVRRALSLSVTQSPCLSAAMAAPMPDEGFAFLHKALDQRTAMESAEANTILMRHFFDLLAGLIGLPLTERLVRTALNAPSGEATSQEIST